MSYLGGGLMPAALGQVVSAAEEDFRLPAMSKEVYFEWASPEEQHKSGELEGQIQDPLRETPVRRLGIEPRT